MSFYCICEECGAKFAGRGVRDTCQKCGGVLKSISKEVFYTNEKIEGIEDDIADLKLQNKVNEYKEKYPEHFKV
jgi:formate dehydrogenase maturation protein FdhE